MTSPTITAPVALQRQTRKEWRAQATVEELLADTEQLQAQAMGYLRWTAVFAACSLAATLFVLALATLR